ncbi:MAG: sigma-70 family RNA polymerase sigma factor [Verrucomicrobiia bacterium]
MDDIALLREYATNHSEAAFETLVSRRVGFVYSAALRQVRDPHLAGEVTQAVFIILAQKAGRISGKTILAGWLFRTTRFAAMAQMRAAAKRRQREQEAQMQSEIQPTEPDLFWEQMSPLLDEALATLGETDRQAVLLRFFENRSMAEVGNQLGTGEDTARKRVSRALEKLHRYFSKRGISSTTAIITGAISANSIHAAPIGLATTITATVAKGPAVAASTLALVKGTLKVMTWMKLKIALGVSAALLLAGGGMTVALSSDTSAGGGNPAPSVFQFRLVLNAPSAKADPMTVVQPGADAKATETLYVQKKVLLDQTDLKSANVITNQPAGKPRIQITLTAAGAKRFAKVTRQNIGKRLAIIIDGRLYSAPTIKSEIRGGNAEINGNFSETEAQDLATRINQSVTK